jgi:putative FmdB family regulatory protein
VPTYEYECEACEKRHEEFQSITAPALKKCPHCGKNKLKRLIGTGAGFIFKGSGFYTTDYRSKEYQDKAKGESSSSKDSGGSSESKSDSKSDSKSSGSTECGSSPKCDSCPAKKT